MSKLIGILWFLIVLPLVLIAVIVAVPIYYAYVLTIGLMWLSGKKF